MAQPIDDPGRALSVVAENAAALVKAELKLAASEAKIWAIRVGIGVGLLWLALLLTQVFVLVAALSPILLSVRPWPTVLLALAIALLPTVAAILFALRELRSLKHLPPAATLPRSSVAQLTSEPKRVGEV